MPKWKRHTLKWLRSLKTGSAVVVREPWRDKDEPGGKTHNAKVSKVTMLNCPRRARDDRRRIHVDGQTGTFLGRSGYSAVMSGYLCIEEPDDEAK